jgi:prepilin-type N-terminal cleavage/methylation domain-containing protein
MKPSTRSPRARRRQSGFTMIEVMIAILVAMVGFMGTVAVQQTVLNATANANDGAVALRLASQTMEQLQARLVRPGTPPVNYLASIASGQWTDPAYVDSAGKEVGAASGAARWTRRVRVTDLGLGLPYNISVQVTYALDSGNPKMVQLDQERRK